MIVPLLDLSLQNGPLRDEILAAIARVADSQRFILGPEVDGFEREMAALAGVEHAVGLSSGTDALLVALMALGIGPGADVIVPTYSFFATAGCVARLGARPVFVDIDPVTFNLDPDALEAALTPATRAIIPVHLFGLCADMPRVLEIAARANVPVIEDAAQAIGARIGDRQAGAMGTCGCFSFFPSKNLGAFGDAGLLTTNDARLAHEARLLRGHGMEPKYFHARVGGNFRIDALQAAVLRVKAPHLAAWTAGRRRNAGHYRALFAEFDLEARAGLTLPIETPGYTHVYNQFVIRGPRRDALREHLTRAGIGTEIYYPLALHRQECFAGGFRGSEVQGFRGSGSRGSGGSGGSGGSEGSGSGSGSFPVADEAAATSLALPIFGELTLDQQRHVVSSIAEFYSS